MPSSKARHTARSWSAAAPLIISPPTAPQPKPSTDSSRPVRPNLRFSTAASCADALPADKIAGKLRVSMIRRAADGVPGQLGGGDAEMVGRAIAAGLGALGLGAVM